MAGIRLEKLRKEFGDVVAVKELSLDFPDGKFAALLGPSGCGKTTTMNMISGLEVPSQGGVYFDDRLMNEVPPGERDVGFVFQNYAIFTHMTVFENISFGLKMKKMPGDQIRKQVGEVAELLQITEMLHMTASRLSVNDMQKVALGRSMITEPRIFLLDEPFSNLDAAFRAYMRGELKRLQREVGQTMIYVTHDQVEAMSMADNIAVMDVGVLQQFGTPEEIYNQPVNTFVANFIGSPNMNLLECSCTVEEGQAYLVHKNSDSRIAIDARRRQLLEQGSNQDNLVLGIRPEHMTVHPSAGESQSVKGVIHFVEPLGPKTIVHLRLGTDVIQVVALPSYKAETAAQQFIEINQDYLHVFDGETGNVIR